MKRLRLRIARYFVSPGATGNLRLGALLTLWAAQLVAITAFGILWLLAAANVDKDAPMGYVQFDELKRYVVGFSWVREVFPIALGVVALQAAILLPLSRPRPLKRRGIPVWISLAGAALLVALLLLAPLLAAVETYEVMGKPVLRPPSLMYRTEFWVGSLVCCWLVTTPLLMRFCRRSNPEQYLSRLSSRLFIGTIVEIAAIIPMDVIVRRRASCYCWSTTYFALVVAGAVGIIAMGPAIILPLLAARRKRWARSRCDCCGYDLSGSTHSERCPECGAGWRPEPDGRASAG
jgi:hypothetical protein